MSLHRALALTLILLGSLAGCITIDDAPGASPRGPGESAGLEAASEPPVAPREVASPGEDDAEMTAEESVAESEDPNPGVPLLFASTRVHTIEGVLALDAIPVYLATSSGAIDVTAGEPGRWRLVATLTGYGATAEMARENRDKLQLSWAHEEDGDHFIQGVVEIADDPTVVGPVNLGTITYATGALALEVPADVAAALALTTSSGDVRVSGVRGPAAALDASSGDLRVEEAAFETLGLHTSSGNIDTRDVTARYLAVDASSGNVHVEAVGVADASLHTSSGNVDAKIAPGESGGIAVDASSGDVSLVVPETSDRGYSAVADTSSGKLTIALADGEAWYDEDGEHGTFVTSGYERREVRTAIALHASSGDVRLAPA